MSQHDQLLPDAQDVAARATDLVTHFLDRDDPVIAHALQPVARAAWNLVADGTGMIELHRAAIDARAALRLTFCPPHITAFVDAVGAYAEGSPPPDWEWDDDEVTDDNPFLAICPEIGLDETFRLAELSGLYMRVAGHFSELTVSYRAVAAAWGNPVDHDPVAGALARMTEGLEDAADLIGDILVVLAMSANTGIGPLRAHMDDLREWPDVLRKRAAWLTGLQPGEPTTDDEYDPPEEGLREAARESEHWVDYMTALAVGARQVGVQIAPFSGR